MDLTNRVLRDASGHQKVHSGHAIRGSSWAQSRIFRNRFLPSRVLLVRWQLASYVAYGVQDGWSGLDEEVERLQPFCKGHIWLNGCQHAGQVLELVA